MARYVVMHPPGRAAVENARIIRDGFSWLAFLVTPLWLLWHRLWLEAVLFGALSVGLVLLETRSGSHGLGAALSLLASLFVGFEGSSLWLEALRRRGWMDWSVVEANTRWEAEVRYAAQVTSEGSSPKAMLTMPWQQDARAAPAGDFLWSWGRR